MRLTIVRQLGQAAVASALLVALGSATAWGADMLPPVGSGDAPFDSRLRDVESIPTAIPNEEPADTGISYGAPAETDDWPTRAVRPEPEPIVEQFESPAPTGEFAEDPVVVEPIPAELPETSAADDFQPPAEPMVEQPLEPIPDPTQVGPAEIEAASFKGVTPGLTTLEEVEKAWGPPKEMAKRDNALTHLFSVEPFEQVEVTYFDDKVATVVIRLARTFPADAVAQQLELTDVRPVLVSDELGTILGQVYPERGVLFAFETSDEPEKASMQVAQIILEAISAEPFVLRAETNLETESEFSLKDLERALELQPAHARAHWLKSRLHLAAGDYEKALSASSEATRIEPANPRYRVTRAQVLAQVGRLDEAKLQCEKAIETAQRRPHVKARAMCLLGDLMASGTHPNYKAAIGYHTQAVQLADPLATSQHPAIRLMAKEVLIDAHLGAAHDIAWGNWKEKEKAVAHWINRAQVLTEDYIENDHGSSQHRFRLSMRVLAAAVGMRGKLDPDEWTKLAVESGEDLINSTRDLGTKAQHQWDLGMAMYDALQVYQMRADHETALKYGEMAIDYLEQGHQYKQSPTASYLLGRLYFRLGAIHAIRDENHRAAISWFDRAVPLLKKPVPQQAFADLGRHGETFVSMAVSYWETGQRDLALELTETGLDLMEQAVKQGLLKESALKVPYSNLASMSRQLGNDETAEQYEELAGRIRTARLQ